MSNLEHRQSKRVEFFIIPAGDHEIRPIWVFGSQATQNALGGVVVNLSGTGVQILTNGDQALEPGLYQLNFIASDTEIPPCDIELVWSETRNSMHVVSGFQFTKAMSDDLQDIMQIKNEYLKPLLRCEIVPIATEAIHPESLPELLH